MPSAAPATALLPRPVTGRVYTLGGKVRLGDVDRNGRLRLDATARFLQDAATDDASDAQLDRRYGWLVRRTMIDTAVSAGIGEDVQTSTWCTAIGRAWAERRSQIIGARGARIDAVSLWVQIDVETGRPARVGDDFMGAYGGAAGGRSVGAGLSLPPPPNGMNGLNGTAWSIRRSDLDPFGHVNNAATWAIVEEAARLDRGDRVGVAELEYPQPIEPDVPVTLSSSTCEQVTSLWVTGPDGKVLASGRWTPVSAT